MRREGRMVEGINGRFKLMKIFSMIQIWMTMIRTGWMMSGEL